MPGTLKIDWTEIETNGLGENFYPKGHTKKEKRKKVDVLLPSNYLIEVVSTTMYIDYVLTSASGIPANIFFHV